MFTTSLLRDIFYRNRGKISAEGRTMSAIEHSVGENLKQKEMVIQVE